MSACGRAAGAARPCRRIIMVGTSFETRGGIAAVVNAYRQAGLFERWPIHYVATHADGNVARKLWAALKGLGALAALLARPGRAILHVHVASRASFWRKSVFMALGALAGCPLVFHLHGGGFARFYEGCGRAGRALVRFFLRRAEVVVVLSERWRDWVLSVAPGRNAICVPNPVVDIPDPLEPRVGERCGNLVLFLGRLDRNKGIYDLLEAVSALRPRMPGIRLVCAGDGELEEVRACAARLGIEDAVTLAGWVGPGERADWLRRADVMVLPSHAEGMPMSVLEAMAAGVPVLASAVGGIPDVITDGVNGLLTEPGDKPMLERLLQRLLQDAGLRARVAAAARETVRLQYAAGKVIERIEGIYSALGAERRHVAVVPVDIGPTREPA